MFIIGVYISGFSRRVFPLMCYAFLSSLTLLNSCGKPLSSEAPGGVRIFNPLRQLQTEIDSILSDSVLTCSNVGIKVVSATTGQSLYNNNAEKLYHPASTMKLITAATSLVKLKPGYQFHTTLYAGTVEAEEVKANIYLKGRGDPHFNTSDLEDMVENLVQSGVKEVYGDVVVDETYFDDKRRGRGWMWDDGPIGGNYSHISALTINHNAVVVKIDPGTVVGDPVHVQLYPPTGYLRIVNRAITTASLEKANLCIERQTEPFGANVLTIRGAMNIGQLQIRRQVDIIDPALYAATLLKERLLSNEIRVHGIARHGKVPDDAIEIANHVSPPLFLVVRAMNKPSDNLTAELLLKTVGAEIVDVPGTTAKGLDVMHQFLKEIGIDTAQSTLADGAGVSRYNLLSASMLTSLLVSLFQDFSVMPEYLASLPVAGVDGTLSRRMKTTGAEKRLRAKTGTMRGVTALAGYTMTADHEILAFAILMSHYAGAANPRRALQDEIGTALAQFSWR